VTHALPNGQLTTGAATVIGENCTMGYPKEARLRGLPGSQGRACPVVIGERCLVFSQVIIYEDVVIGDDCVLEDRVRIGYGSRVGPRCRFAYGAYICDRVTVGADARVAGFVCDTAVIGDRSTVMGELVHEYSRPHQDWWQADEASPVIEADTVIGYGATVVGGVRVGPRSYVSAGAVVTRDVPPLHVVTGVNKQVPAARWTGRRLRGLLRHWSDT
jgi:acetyltransferase-like isoleucine patch superfamily enzyme